MTGIDKL